MRNLKKKGFTIVELVIVIAVIAILAAVLIPTFTGVVEEAEKSAAMQEAKNQWTEYTAEHSDFAEKDAVICIDGYHFTVTKGQFSATANEKPATDNHEGYTKEGTTNIYIKD